MNIKPRPNHRMYLETLARMTPSERLRKAFELSDLSKRQFMQNLREELPDLSADDFKMVLIERLTRNDSEKIRIGNLFLRAGGVQ